eukprot:GHVU01121711.1.p1 GENE.GHVU01121711.1~~GHVU01121711.1.p1  ORF type:complete len:113 (+),score=8.07 GHVU01121711.1:541-879(+)
MPRLYCTSCVRACEAAAVEVAAVGRRRHSKSRPCIDFNFSFLLNLTASREIDRPSGVLAKYVCSFARSLARSCMHVYVLGDDDDGSDGRLTCKAVQTLLSKMILRGDVQSYR